MREKLKKIVAYILRSWEDEPKPPPLKLKIIPPFFIELLSYFIGLAILYQIGVYVNNLITIC